MHITGHAIGRNAVVFLPLIYGKDLIILNAQVSVSMDTEEQKIHSSSVLIFFYVNAFSMK